MHSYREAFEDSEADGFAHSPTFSGGSGGGGGESSPQIPRFPVSPQTPYFNMCRFTPKTPPKKLTYSLFFFIELILTAASRYPRKGQL